MPTWVIILMGLAGCICVVIFLDSFIEKHPIKDDDEENSYKKTVWDGVRYRIVAVSVGEFAVEMKSSYMSRWQSPREYCHHGVEYHLPYSYCSEKECEHWIRQSMAYHEKMSKFSRESDVHVRNNPPREIPPFKYTEI